MKYCIAVLIVSLTLISFSYAEQSEELMVDGIDLSELSQTARNEIIKLKSQQAKKATPTVVDKLKSVDPQTVTEWGTAMATMIKTFCHELGVEVNEFIKTPAGLIISGLIIYNYAGDELINRGLRIIVGFLILIFNFIWIGVGWLVVFGNKKKISYVDVDDKKPTKIVERELRFPHMHHGDWSIIMFWVPIILMGINILITCLIMFN